MIFLYKLTFYSRHNDGRRNGFDIGVFRTEQDAASVARGYLAEVPGFCEYECQSQITPVRLSGEDAIPDAVWSWSGWNWNEDGDEINILEGNFFTSEAAAAADMAKAQVESPRAEWACDRCIVGKCEWEEGFVRYTYDA